MTPEVTTRALNIAENYIHRLSPDVISSVFSSPENRREKGEAVDIKIERNEISIAGHDGAIHCKRQDSI
jgi:hypothetical protein